VVICLEQGADLHTAQLMPLPLTLSCFSIIQISFTFLVPAHLGSPDKGPLNGCSSCTSVLHVCAQHPRAANKSLIVTIRKYAVNRFYPPDALLVRVLAMALCLCLSVSITSQCSLETVEQIGLFFGMGASYHLSYIVL